MSLVAHLALVSESDTVDFSELARVGAAIQKQVVRDLEPLWDVRATVNAFASLDDVPPGYWPIIIKDDIELDAAGIHCDRERQPIALVTAEPAWSLTASHEALEMLTDPFGNRLVAGQSPDPGQGRVEFLVEVADPVTDRAFAYTVNGVLVSDFYTPRYFDPLRAEGVRYSFTGAIQEPREVLRGGYLVWHDPEAGEWWQQSWFSGDAPATRSLGPILPDCGLRSAVDRITARHRAEQDPGWAQRWSRAAETARAPAEAPPSVDRAPTRASEAVLVSSRAKAAGWRALIRDLT
jgi:hypothetical protein